MSRETEKTNSGGTVVLPCTCRHKFQDEAYGAGKRLHNVTNTGARCTVCGHNQ